MTVHPGDDDERSGVFEAPPVEDELAPVDRARTIAGRYEIVERIGEGGMGQVLRVRHRRLGKPFALKLMQAEFSLDPESRQIFHREARLASALSHPNVVSIVDFGEDPDWGLFIVMEYLDGETLSKRIDRHGGLPIPVACDVAEQLVGALHHSHSNQVVHGDLKSDNVLCLTTAADERRKWVIKLLDFGTAHLMIPGKDGPKTRIAGTPEYVAPERIAGNSPQPSMDVYALGIILYEMLAGSVPFAGDDPQEILERQLRAAPESPSVRRGELIDPELVSIVLTAMAKAPEDRYPDVLALGRDLRAFMDKLGLKQRLSARRSTSESGDARAAAAAAAFDSLGIAAAGLDADGTIVVANTAFARLLKHEHGEDLEGATVLESPLVKLHPGLREDLRLAAMDSKVVRRRLLVKARGDRLVMRLVLTPATGSCGSCILALHTIPRGGGGDDGGAGDGDGGAADA